MVLFISQPLPPRNDSTFRTQFTQSAMVTNRIETNINSWSTAIVSTTPKSMHQKSLLLPHFSKLRVQEVRAYPKLNTPKGTLNNKVSITKRGGGNTEEYKSILHRSQASELLNTFSIQTTTNLEEKDAYFHKMTIKGWGGGGGEGESVITYDVRIPYTTESELLYTWAINQPTRLLLATKGKREEIKTHNTHHRYNTQRQNPK